MTDPRNRRIEFVDLTKGICIILVIMSHIGGAFDKLDSHSMLVAFRMPLYFFISGLFFKSYEGFQGFALRKVNKLLIPFLFFYVGSFLLKYTIWIVAPGTFQQPVSWSELLLIFQGHSLIKFNPPIWFLVALFNCNILFYLVHYLRKRVGLMFIAILLIGATGFFLGKKQIVLPLYTDIAMTALPFYAGGFWIRRYNFFLFPHRLDKLIPVIVIFSACILYFFSSSPGMRTNHYSGNIFQLYVAAFAGIFSIMLLCKKIRHIPIVSYLGRYSIITLSIHGPILHFAHPMAVRYLHNEWLQAFGLLGLVLVISLISTPVFLKLIPQVVAQKNLIRIINCD